MKRRTIKTTAVRHTIELTAMDVRLCLFGAHNVPDSADLSIDEDGEASIEWSEAPTYEVSND